MIYVPLLTWYQVNEQQDGSADDFQVANDERRAFKGKSVMDAALEDRICDLYDLYVEGMDEDKGPQSRKLYVELAELWPQATWTMLESKMPFVDQRIGKDYYTTSIRFATKRE